MDVNSNRTARIRQKDRDTTPVPAAGTHNQNISNRSRDNRSITESTAEGRTATAGMPEILEMPTTVPASAVSQQHSVEAHNSGVFAEIFKKVTKTVKIHEKS
jgi:hypothetical protein